MPFLVRKLAKRDKLIFPDGKDIMDIYADIPTTEFRTDQGRLSTWKIDSLDDITNAVLAIAVTSSEITKMDFIIIDMELLKQNNLDYEQTYAGMDIAIPDLQDTHYDIENISLKKLEKCTNIYRTINNEEEGKGKYIVRYLEAQIIDLLIEAIKQDRVDHTKAKGKIRTKIEELERKYIIL